MDGDEAEDDSQKSPDNKKSAFTSNSNLHKKQVFPTSSFLKRTAFTRDSESHDKYQTPQRYRDPALSTKSPSSSSRADFHLRQDSNERFRQEVVQQVKVRVEELQSRMKSKIDMFYVMRHMCKKRSCLNRLRWVSPSRIRWLPNSVHEGYSNLNKKKYACYSWFRLSQALKMEDVRLIAVPFYDSLSIRRNWQDVRQLYHDITCYFPDYDPEYMPSRKFFWEIFASLHYEDVKTIIKNERKRKYEKEADDKTKEIIISKDVLNQIQGSRYYSKKKGRDLLQYQTKGLWKSSQVKEKAIRARRIPRRQLRDICL